MTKTFYFNTGVRPELVNNPPFAYDYHANKGNVIKGGTLQIPFTCDDVPDGAIFLHACDIPDLPESRSDSVIVREITGGGLLSKFAYFRV